MATDGGDPVRARMLAGDLDVADGPGLLRTPARLAQPEPRRARFVRRFAS